MSAVLHRKGPGTWSDSACGEALPGPGGSYWVLYGDGAGGLLVAAPGVRPSRALMQARERSVAGEVVTACEVCLPAGGRVA